MLGKLFMLVIIIILLIIIVYLVSGKLPPIISQIPQLLGLWSEQGDALLSVFLSK